ncbi:MAG TPA: permease-like cell division protein FtsX [Acidimicrobiia bacterium]|nr:permease-like cell division protein FtsX [Acidimicrobiia bacterium]
MVARSGAALVAVLMAGGLFVACSGGNEQNGKELPAARLPRSGSDVAIFMDIGATQNQISRLRGALGHARSVRRFAFVSPEDGLPEIRRQAPDDSTFRDTDPSELPPAFHVVLRDRTATAEFKADFESRAGVDEVVETPPSQRVDPERARRCTGPAPRVEVYMKIDATADEINAVEAALARDSTITQVRRVSQQEALLQFRCLFADQPDLRDSVSADALPASFRLELAPGVDAAALENRYSTVAGVDEVISNATTLAH